MDKYVKHAYTVAILLVLLLMYSATKAQCKIMEDVDNKKINLPDGLCSHHARWYCAKGYCFCCFLNNRCYRTIDACRDVCLKSSHSGTVAPANNALLSLN
uniref:Uncharacterized protein n=1 Tax=Avena sativa TaxID=4498 RepID=A0ACD5XTE9_AVESA